MRFFYVILYFLYFVNLNFVNLENLYAQAVGSEACKTCHLDIYQQWTQSIHAKSLLTIPPSQQRNPHCLSCHIDPIAKDITPLDLSEMNNLTSASAITASAITASAITASAITDTAITDTAITDTAMINTAMINTAIINTTASGLNPALISQFAPIEQYTQGVGCEACHGYATAYLKRGIKQAWWTLKYQSPQMPVARKNKKIMLLKKQAQKLGLKRGNDIVICKRCHEGVSTHITPLDLKRALFKMKHINTELSPKIKPSDEQAKRSIIIKP
jgi:hypothetical protein